MLPKKRRISRIELESVIKRGLRHNSSNLLLYLHKNNSKYSSFSFSVPKKVSQTAVSRNKNRRRGYAVISKKIELVKPGFACLFVFKKGSGSISYEKLEKEVLELLYSTNVLI